MREHNRDASRCLAAIGLCLTTAIGSGCLGDGVISTPSGTADPFGNRPGPGGSGGSGGGVPGEPPMSACTQVPEPGRSPLRHLTNDEFDETVLDLLGDASKPSQRFPADSAGLGYDNNADAYSVSTLHVERHLEAVEKLAAAAKLDLLLPCTPSAGTDACADAFIASFARRAYRRPVTALDIAPLAGVYRFGTAQVGFAAGIRLVIQTVLLGADFQYRPEVGQPGASGEVVALTDHELATRLSYFLWGSMPDITLLDAADRGELHTRAQVAAQARRMLSDARTRPNVVRFHRQWLELAGLDTLEKDPVAFPKFAGVRTLLQRETDLFVDSVFWDPAATATDLFTRGTSFMNKPLAAFYGVTGPAGAAFEPVTLPAGQRLGLLTQASVMAAYAQVNETHPVLRGKLVRERVFCQHLAPPPDNVQIVPPDPDPSLTTRERYAEHSKNPACATCHALTDPIGFAFEHYDGSGAWRSDENGKPIDASGTLHATPDSNGPFTDALELVARVGKSTAVKNCIATQWFRYAQGRGEAQADGCSLEQARGLFHDAHDQLPELLIALTQTDAFLFRRAVAPGGTP